jgi:hypothetical protein
MNPLLYHSIYYLRQLINRCSEADKLTDASAYNRGRGSAVIIRLKGHHLAEGSSYG